MSRIGKLPIPLPAGVKITREGDTVTVEGPKGKNVEQVPPEMKIEVSADRIDVRRPDDSKKNRALHGLTRSLINNAVVGVTKGFTRKLEIVGVGYRALISDKNLSLELGYSHKIEVVPPEGVAFEVPAPGQIIVSGINKQVVGEVAANIRGYRPPEPYKGKGVHYEGEYIIRKAGKAGATSSKN
ncbi:MAG: 50S ribosomal protein L6 [Candidatus Glassbacteria bacterium]|nr:50S ribosomal protein L6 [Candidatus Glassbacteria bacterium]